MAYAVANDAVACGRSRGVHHLQVCSRCAREMTTECRSLWGEAEAGVMADDGAAAPSRREDGTPTTPAHSPAH